MLLNQIIKKLKQKEELNNEDLNIIFQEFKTNKSLEEISIKEFISSWYEKGYTPNEIYALARLINSQEIETGYYPNAIDLCGTGGDKSNTFNISTLTAIVASSLNIPVIKHSGKSNTSITGSADILNEFNINIDNDKAIKEKCFKSNNLMFVSSTVFRNVFGIIKTISKQINIPSLVNLIGPLTNPYKTEFHLLGVSNPHWGELLAEVVKLQNEKEKIYKKTVLIICCEIEKNKYLDELSFCGENHLWLINNKIEKLDDYETTQKAGIDDLIVKNKAESKLVFERVLKGEAGTKDILEKIKTVSLNSGCALFLTKKADSLEAGYKKSIEHIQTGMAWEHFQDFISCNNC